MSFEVNTECFFCNNTSSVDNPKMSYNILDAIGKVEINRYVNIWGGRMLVPTERGELSGPFFQATHDAFKTPFFPQDFSVKFGSNGAGRYGRDDGGTFWGSVEPGFVKGTLGYAVGVYRGLQSSSTVGPNQGNDVTWAGRFTYNFLNPEKNPGYYTSSTYFGKAGDILALSFGANYQKNGRARLPIAVIPWPGWRFCSKSLAEEMGVATVTRIQTVLRHILPGFCRSAAFDIRWKILDGYGFTDTGQVVSEIPAVWQIHQIQRITAAREEIEGA